MFGGCKSLENINLENFETPKLFDMSSIFSECYNLTEINITNFSFYYLKVYKFSFSNL